MDRREHYPRGVPYSINYPEVPLYAFLENSARWNLHDSGAITISPIVLVAWANALGGSAFVNFYRAISIAVLDVALHTSRR